MYVGGSAGVRDLELLSGPSGCSGGFLKMFTEGRHATVKMFPHINLTVVRFVHTSGSR